MKIIKLDFENCFGIGKLKHEFDFSKVNSYLIYAPNGTMKTSFAKTFDLISKNDKKDLPKDVVYNKKSKFEILSDDLEINPESIFVINAEDNSYDATNKITSFIARKELKEKYDQIYSELNTAKAELLKKLKAISKSTDCEVEYMGTFSNDSDKNFFDVLSSNVDQLTEDSDKVTFKYNTVFDTKGIVKKFLDKNENLLDDYVENYNQILSNSKLFKLSGDNTFGTYQANEIMKSIEDNSYFDAGHKFVLEDGTEITESSQLKEIYNAELERILADEKLKESFNKVDKAIGANVDLRAFKQVIEQDNSLLVNLKDYEGFKKKVWTSFVSEVKNDAEALSEMYEEKKKELDIIISESKKEVELWKDIIKKFNDRFYVPFEVKMGNLQDVILKRETANLVFIFTDKNEESKPQTKENLLKILSKGEQRAYFILQFLFEIESRKNNSKETLLIFDDIADSFDYKNKYAIIEYIIELHQSEKFKSLILTHNFDFYRTIASRLNMDKQTYMTSKDENRTINIVEGLYKKDLFKEFLKSPHDPKVFISLISFIRNIIDYSDSSETDDCIKLTSCLHEKTNSKDITIDDVFTIYKNRITKLKDKEVDFDKTIKIQNFIFDTADSIIEEKNINEILLENKITLAIASRLKAEQYMISKLPEADLTKINHVQTRVLSNMYKKKYPTSLNLGIIDKVNLMTPENIHVNSFMYEPLIDMSVYHLLNLYQETKNLK
ncbi:MULTISPECIES: hypothetical protein [Chryseobacterium]|uniref:Energy-coupling factor transporter ATP-binding protein EcfA2 n=1 Tax=Chryseobacterium camelliae TaxID=1265445 RepID=A0ABU0TFM4_9FLAO|nr:MULTISPECIES: hypothetical protein [Chryseobacterium]MDT3406342.1 energy-coupling factor transporter ATP-binding protein EcfA2 [Pseudacidovorax intermedius]MDQ1095859.1 energy-coupling factor transporter ATP-binding protein EcfA2 [Chryseobacterium camelliae]MDQ1099795.1 energy-coupling factor transporter ATP-binding protein EcfA2 [Chryseobacterium sp. SORGH_AS_1048]MDR6087142.1 energy-coupling factor transporter ATP-binding protein EcfA2 [Chryseobacterium sp. SORGH_AS_0909]MDR6131515.1 ener